MVKEEKFIPALRFDWLTPLYDPILRWVMREEQFKKQLVRQAMPIYEPAGWRETILDVSDIIYF